MLFDNAVTNTQPQASALSHALRGVKGIENAVRFLDARARVLKLGNNVSVVRVDPDLERSAAAQLQHRVDTIVDDVQKHLLQLVRISRHSGNSNLDLALH